MSMNSNRGSNNSDASSSASSNDDERVAAKMMSKYNKRSSSRSMNLSELKEHDSGVGTSIASSSAAGDRSQSQLSVTVGPPAITSSSGISPTGGSANTAGGGGNKQQATSMISPNSGKSHRNHPSAGATSAAAAPSVTSASTTGHHRRLVKKTPSKYVVKDVRLVQELESVIKSLYGSSHKSNRGGNDMAAATTDSSTAASYITTASFNTSSGYSASSDSTSAGQQSKAVATTQVIASSASQDVFAKPSASLNPNLSYHKFKSPSTIKSSLNEEEESSSSIDHELDPTVVDVSDIVLQAIKTIKKMKHVANLNTTSSTIGDEGETTSVVTSKNQITTKNKKKNSSSGESSSASAVAEIISSSSGEGKQEVVAANLLTQQDEAMHISILVKSGLIIYVDDRLTNLLGQSAKNWIDKKPMGYLYKPDESLWLTKLCEFTNLINASKKNIADIEIEPFYLRFRKETTSFSESNTAIDSTRPKFYLSESNMDTGVTESRDSLMPRLVHSTESGDEYVAFRVVLRGNQIELKTMQSVSGSTGHNSNRSSTDKQSSSCSNSGENHVIEDCIMFNLTFPTIAYYQKVNMFSEQRSFISQHDVNLRFTRVENKVTELLGYLPQDMESRRITKFIHADDLIKIKLSHIDLFNRHAFLINGSDVRQPRFDSSSSITHDVYRWRCYNGCYITVHTDWSCYIHPWQKQIDFIIGRHTVLDAPSNKNIFESPSRHINSEKQISEHRGDMVMTNPIAAVDSLTTTSSSGAAYDHHQKLITKQMMNNSSENSSMTNDNQLAPPAPPTDTYRDRVAAVAAVAAVVVAAAAVTADTVTSNETTSNTESGGGVVVDKTNDLDQQATNNNKLLFEFQSVSSDTIKKIEKEIIEYISRKIPGPDERTQQMGDEVLRFVRTSNKSALYIQKQKRLLKKSRKQELAKTPVTPVKIKQKIPYGGHFPRLNQSQTQGKTSVSPSHRHHNPAYAAAAANKTIRNNSNKIKYSSQKLTEVDRIKSHKRKRDEDDTHKAVSGSRKEKAYKSGGGDEATAMMATTTETTTAVAALDSEKHQKYMNLSQLPGDIGQGAIMTTTPGVNDQMDVRMEAAGAINSHQLETTIDDQSKEIICKKEADQAAQQSAFMALAASGKRHIQPQLLKAIKENGLLGNYTMWTYIEELPDEWTDEATNLATNLATIDAGTGAGNPSACGGNHEMPLEEMEVFSPKQDEDESEASSSEAGGDDKPDEAVIKPPVTSTEAVQLQPSTTITSRPRSLNRAVQHQQQQQVIKSRDSSSTSIPPQYQTNINQHQQPISTPLNMINFNKKAASSVSSKSHSKIVLVDENDNNNDDEELPPSSSNFRRVCREKPTRLTIDALAKHTYEQDELFSLEILKRLRRPIKQISDIPTNICAFTPNIFSRNEYEPNVKRHKHLVISQNIDESNNKLQPTPTNQQLLINTTTAAPHGHMSSANSPKPLAPPSAAPQFNSPTTQLLRETEAAGPYSHNLNEIDLDDPQTYEEIYQKKLENDYYYANQQEQKQQSNDAHQNRLNNQNATTSNKISDTNLVKINQSEEIQDQMGRAITENMRLASQKRARKLLESAKKRKMMMATNSSTTITTSTSSGSSNEMYKCHRRNKKQQLEDQTGSKTATTTNSSSVDDQLDILEFWERCQKFGSQIAMRLKKAEMLFKDIKSVSKILKVSSTGAGVGGDNMDVDYPKSSISCSEIGSKTTTTTEGGGGSTSTLNEDKRNKLSQRLDSMNKSLKKELYEIARMVGITTDFGVDDGSIDSNKTDHLDQHIKKIHVELLKTYPFYVSQYNKSQKTARSSDTGGQHSDSNPAGGGGGSGGSSSSAADFSTLDVNSTKLLFCIYDSLKAKFFNQFQRFDQSNMSFTTMTSNATTTTDRSSMHPSTTATSSNSNESMGETNKQTRQQQPPPTDEMIKNLHIPRSSKDKRCRKGGGNEGRTTSDYNLHLHRHHRVGNSHVSSHKTRGSKNQKTSSTSTTSKRKSDDMFLIPTAASSNNNNNNPAVASSSHYDEDYYDDESYLYDSPTSSLESLENLSTLNDESVLKMAADEERHDANVKMSQQRKQDEDRRELVKHEATGAAVTAIGATTPPSLLLKEDVASTTTTSNNSFDDKLCSKLISGFGGLVKHKQAVEAAAEQKRTQQQRPTTNVVLPSSSNLKNQVDGENDDVDKKSSSVTSSDSSQNDGPDDENIKLLRLNIYDDCFKCLSKHAQQQQQHRHQQQQHQNQPQASRSNEKSDKSSSTITTTTASANVKKESETSSSGN